MKRTTVWMLIILALLAAIAPGIVLNMRERETTSVNNANTSTTNQTPTTSAATLLLNELGEKHLSSTEAADIISSLTSKTVYAPDAAAELGDVECGTSTRHDQLVTLNNGPKTFWVANGGLRITATPNTFNWTNTDIDAFVRDETVVCGVGTTVPRVIVGDRVLWWDVCVGGAGPPSKTSPEYSTVVRCLQAKEVIDSHFGIVTE